MKYVGPFKRIFGFFPGVEVDKYAVGGEADVNAGYLPGHTWDDDPVAGGQYGSDPYDGEKYGSDPYDGEKYGSDPYDGEKYGSDPFDGEKYGCDGAYGCAPLNADPMDPQGLQGVKGAYFGATARKAVPPKVFRILAPGQRARNVQHRLWSPLVGPLALTGFKRMMFELVNQPLNAAGAWLKPAEVSFNSIPGAARHFQFKVQASSDGGVTWTDVTQTIDADGPWGRVTTINPWA